MKIKVITNVSSILKKDCLYELETIYPAIMKKFSCTKLKVAPQGAYDPKMVIRDYNIEFVTSKVETPSVIMKWFKDIGHDVMGIETTFTEDELETIKGLEVVDRAIE